MKPIPVLLIFDIGKTNKKLFLFNEAYQVVHEIAVQLDETIDEDGFACEDIIALFNWIKSSIKAIKEHPAYDIKQIHYSAYGASFVFMDHALNPMLPFYNYLKPFKASTQEQFEISHGSMEQMSLATASPFLGNLNSGLQLYRLKVEQPEKYYKIKWALHLPQFVHFLITGKLASDMTSIGCHTMLWNFAKNNYQDWVIEEGIDKILPPIEPQVGLHDSSAALIPYLSSFEEPFVLISTGTWCISLNPFNDTVLTTNELNQDTLCFLSYNKKPVKASRLFSGKEHEQAVLALNKHFNKDANYYTQVKYDAHIILLDNFNTNDLSDYVDFETAYHHLVGELVKKQITSTNIIIAHTKVNRIFVDGGFSNNEIFMNLLAKGYSQYEVYAAAIPQASALGAALAVHHKWNTKSIPNNLISLQYYSTVN